MSDLVRGKYPVTDPKWSLMGQPSNASQAGVAARTNYTHGLALTDGAALSSGVATAVAIPVEIGDVITAIDVIVGATAEATGTHAYAALYSGIATPALLAQSTDATGAAAVAASARFSFTLASAVTITSAIAPTGFVYASICVTATTVPTLASFTVAAAVAYQWFSTAPAKMGAVTHGSGLVGVAPATIASPAAQAVTPVVFLR